MLRRPVFKNSKWYLEPYPFWVIKQVEDITSGNLSGIDRSGSSKCKDDWMADGVRTYSEPVLWKTIEGVESGSTIENHMGLLVVNKECVFTYKVEDEYKEGEECSELIGKDEAFIECRYPGCKEWKIDSVDGKKLTLSCIDLHPYVMDHFSRV